MSAVSFASALASALLLLLTPAALVLLSRLLRGARRQPPVPPATSQPADLGTVSVIVPTLNEVERIAPCLAGLSRQGYALREVLVVDSNSQDGTRDRVKAAQRQDPRFRLLTDLPLPTGWVGRPWALHTGFQHSSPQSEWVLGLDADTQPQPGLLAGIVAIARRENYDLLSLSPQFILKSPGEWWLQPALLMTLLYRFEASGCDAPLPERVMANGQCFLCRRAVLVALDGYTAARRSFCDDVTLARYAAAQGYRVGFLDGKRLLKVRMYEGARETWQEWGRSLDLKDASPRGQIWGDLWLLTSVQALPLPLGLVSLAANLAGYSSRTLLALTSLCWGLVAIRWALLLAIAPSYDRSQLPAGSWLFWLSPLADPLAVARIWLSSFQRPRQWRGRIYPAANPVSSTTINTQRTQ
ncbi:MAG: glycosyltransferase [Spirulinaceae cyanobacterium SM2_1_0]|nr:glycosyltransferase [Spirulinaceae cyanobacterium SM2_1_0]